MEDKPKSQQCLLTTKNYIKFCNPGGMHREKMLYKAFVFGFGFCFFLCLKGCTQISLAVLQKKLRYWAAKMLYCQGVFELLMVRKILGRSIQKLYGSYAAWLSKLKGTHSITLDRTSAHVKLPVSAIKTQSWVTAIKPVAHQLLNANIKLCFHLLIYIWRVLVAFNAYWKLRKQKSSLSCS